MISHPDPAIDLELDESLLSRRERMMLSCNPDAFWSEQLELSQITDEEIDAEAEADRLRQRQLEIERIAGARQEYVMAFLAGLIAGGTAVALMVLGGMAVAAGG